MFLFSLKKQNDCCRLNFALLRSVDGFTRFTVILANDSYVVQFFLLFGYLAWRFR